MCAVSMISDHGMKMPPWQDIRFPQRPLPDKQAVDAIKEFLDLLKAAKKYDIATGQPHCEDPEKAKFEQVVLNRLAEIERRLGISNGQTFAQTDK